MIFRGEELVDYIYELLDTNKGDLGLEYITFGDGQLIPFYPAATVVYDSTQREDRGTHYFLIEITCDIYVMHGKLTLDRQQRNKADLELATRVTNLLHVDRTLGGQVVSSLVKSEEPGTVSTQNDTIIGTQLRFVATQRESFR